MIQPSRTDVMLASIEARAIAQLRQDAIIKRVEAANAARTFSAVARPCDACGTDTYNRADGRIVCRWCLAAEDGGSLT